MSISLVHKEVQPGSQSSIRILYNRSTVSIPLQFFLGVMCVRNCNLIWTPPEADNLRVGLGYYIVSIVSPQQVALPRTVQHQLPHWRTAPEVGIRVCEMINAWARFFISIWISTSPHALIFRWGHIPSGKSAKSWRCLVCPIHTSFLNSAVPPVDFPSSKYGSWQYHHGTEDCRTKKTVFNLTVQSRMR